MASDSDTTSKALTVLRDTVRKPDSATQTSPTGTRLVSFMRQMSWSPNRPLSVAEIIQISAVLICLDVISQDIAKVHFRMYEKIPGGKREVAAEDHPVAELLSYRPNANMTWYEFWIMILLHYGMVQNAFIAKRITNGQIEELIPCMPARTTILCVDPEQDSAGRGFYCYQVDRFSHHERIQLAGLPGIFLPGEFIHLRGRMFDGQIGYSNLDAGAKTFGMANELQEYSTRLFASDGGTRGVFQKPGEAGDSLSDKAFERLREQLAELLTDMRRNNVPIVLEEGMTFQQISMNAEQAEASKSKDQAVVDVARTFRIPPHKIMHLINVKYENMETLEKSYVQDSLIPICRLVEDKMKLSLLSRKEQGRYFFEFDRREMLLNDQEKLAEVMKTLGGMGALEIDEMRTVMGWNPLQSNAGQVRLIPSTYNAVDRKNEVVIPAGAQPQNNGGDPNQTGDGTQKPDKKPAKPKKDAGDDNVVEFPSMAGEV